MISVNRLGNQLARVMSEGGGGGGGGGVFYLNKNRTTDLQVCVCVIKALVMISPPLERKNTCEVRKIKIVPGIWLGDFAPWCVERTPSRLITYCLSLRFRGL